MKTDPEEYVSAGQALIDLGRTIQRTFPPVSVEGAQHGEDSILEPLLPNAFGWYVDIGAHAPKDCSNTWRLYQRGWRGLLIDPLPEAWPVLLLERPEDYLCPIAASDRDGYATLNLCRSVSSLSACWRKDNEARMPVMTERMDTIMRRYPMIDHVTFCSMDVEGWERQVLLGIDWKTFHPDIFMVEYAAQDGRDQSADWLHLLTAQGYVEHFKGSLNMILQRK